jgi:ornithine decarboxylase
MNLSAVEAAYRRFTTAMPSIAVHYAMKCNPHRDVLATLRSLGCRFEIASAPELGQLLALGVDAATVLYSNPVKPVTHIRAAYAGGVRCYVFDSLEEATKLAALAPGSNAIVRLSARAVRSGVPSEGKFGVDPDTAVRLLIRARSLGLIPYGIAFHVGSQMLFPKAWQPPLVAVDRIMRRLAEVGIVLRMVDLGGGFPARYGVTPPPLERYAAVIHAGLDALPYPVRAVVEPGRAIAAGAGTLTATVIGTAVRNGKRWIHLDVGAFNGLMESLETGNTLRFPVSDSRGSAVRDRFQLTGPTCDSQDTILFDVELSADLSTGDLVHIATAGAYTAVYASTFNGFEVPAVSCVSEGRPLETAID